MPGLQGIDSDYTPLTEGSSLSQESQGLKPINDNYKPSSTPSTGGSYESMPISYLQPTLADMQSRQLTSSQDVQSKTQDIQKPNFGTMLLLGMLGGPRVVNEYYQRTMQKQVEPIVQDINLGYRDALNRGDFQTAQRLVGQLAPLTSYSPTAAKLHETFVNEIAKRQDNIQQNKIYLNGLIGSGLIKEGTPAYRDLTNPSTLLQDKDMVQKKVELYKRSGQVIGGIYTTIEGFTQEPVKQYVMPEATKPVDLPKVTQDALITKIGHNAIPRYAMLQTKVSSGQATPDEVNDFKAYNSVIGPQAAQNVALQQLTAGERAKLNLRPGLAEEMLSPEGTAQQGNVQPSSAVKRGNVSRSNVPANQQVDTARQGFILNTEDMVANKEISREQADAMYARRGIQLSMPQGPYQEARASETQANVAEIGGKAVAQHVAEAGYKPQAQLVGYKVDKNGHLQQSPTGMSVDQLNAANWHVESVPDAERKGLMDFPKFQSMYEHVKNEVLTNPVFKEPDKYKAWWDIAKTYYQQGLPIPFTSINLGGTAVGSEDRQYLASALATMGQMVETISNPSLKDNVAIGALKNYITSPNAKPSGIISALDAVHDTALAGVKGVVGTTKGAVEEGVTARDIKRERESRSQVPVQSTTGENTPLEKGQEPGVIRKKKAPVEEEKAKGPLDRSKFKRVE